MNDFPCQYPGCERLARKADAERKVWYPDDPRPAFCDQCREEIEDGAKEFKFIDDGSGRSKGKGFEPSVPTGCSFPRCQTQAITYCSFCNNKLCTRHGFTSMKNAPSVRLCGECNKTYSICAKALFWIVDAQQIFYYTSNSFHLPEHIKRIPSAIYNR